jgi:predicted outer membrane repeat protein
MYSYFSTFNGNSAVTTGGAIFNDTASELNLLTTTISGNTTINNSVAGSSVGGAFYTRGTTSVLDCTITANTSS